MQEPKKPKKITEPFGFAGGQMLTDLLTKGPDAITELERDVLRARRSYLTDEQIRKFGVDEQKERLETIPTDDDSEKDEPEPEPKPEPEPEPEKEPSDKKKKEKKGRK